MITTNQKLSITPNPCYCRLSLDQFLQIPNLIGVGQWEKLKQKSESLFLSTGKPDNNCGSLGWEDGGHMNITLAEYPSTGEVPWTLRRTGFLHAWQSREIELCLWHQLIFSPSSTPTCSSRARCFHCLHIDYTFSFPLHPVLFAYVAGTFLRTKVLL